VRNSVLEVIPCPVIGPMRTHAVVGELRPAADPTPTSTSYKRRQAADIRAANAVSALHSVTPYRIRLSLGYAVLNGQRLLASRKFNIPSLESALLQSQTWPPMLQ
jgi:hypothetical protein